MSAPQPHAVDHGMSTPQPHAADHPMSAWPRLLRLVLPFRGRILIAALLGFGTVGSGIGLMAVSAFLIASAAFHPSIAELQVAIVGVRFFGISRGAFRYLERLLSHDVTFRLLARLRVWFYEALEPLAPARLLEYRSGDLLARAVADVESLEHFYVRGLAPPLVAAGVLAAMTVFAWRFDSRLAALVAAFLSISGVALPFWVYRLGREPSRRLAEARSRLNEAVVEGVQGMADLVAFGQGDAQAERVYELGRGLIRFQTRMARITGWQTGLGVLLNHLAVWCLLVLAIPMVRDGEFSAVSLAVLALAVLASFEAVLPLASAGQFLESQFAAARRVFQIVDARPAVTDPPDPIPVPRHGGLELRAVTFSYPGNTEPALREVSLSLPAGARVAVVGPSGAGKSTLAHLLLRFWDPQVGMISLAGHDIRRYRQRDLRQALGVVSQDTHLFTGTVRENLLLARPDATSDDLTRAARRARIHEDIVALPKGYDTWIGEQGVRLSGGQRQRLAIARTLLRDPPFLVLDEATANLDAMTERTVLRSLHELMEGRTSLVITHRLANMEPMDEILVLARGRIVERGTHAELLARDGLYRKMWNLERLVLAEWSDVDA